MKKVISLSKARKSKAKAEARKRADANAVYFGTPKALRDAESARKANTDRALDGHQRTDTDDV